MHTYFTMCPFFEKLNKIRTIKNNLYKDQKNKSCQLALMLLGKDLDFKGTEIVVVVKVTEARGRTSEWEQGWHFYVKEYVQNISHVYEEQVTITVTKDTAFCLQYEFSLWVLLRMRA